MNSDIYRRVPLLVLGLLAFLALSCTSAFAAGLPTIGGFQPDSNAGTLNSKGLEGSVNPNGASTTYKIEYGTTEALGSSTTETSIGSGTTSVSIHSVLKGLLPETQYYARLVAKNSYGTVHGTTVSAFKSEAGRWAGAFHKFKRVPASYESEGSFVINFPSLGAEITCNSTGNGALGNWGGIGDYYYIHPHNCSVYINGTRQCSATVPTLPLNERLILSGEAFTVNFWGECPAFFIFGEQVTLPALEAFTATSGEISERNPIGLQAPTTYGTHKGTITDSSTWYLTGENAGTNFGIYNAY